MREDSADERCPRSATARQLANLMTLAGGKIVFAVPEGGVALQIVKPHPDDAHRPRSLRRPCDGRHGVQGRRGMRG